MAKKCLVCGRTPSWDELLQQRPDIPDRFDSKRGITLTEAEQLAHDEEICVGCIGRYHELAAA